MYRLSDHNRVIKTGWHWQTWLPREDLLCQLCPHRQLETHFLLQCSTYQDIRTKFFIQIECQRQDFDSLSDQIKMQHVLGENRVSAIEAAWYVRVCHSLRDEQHNNTWQLQFVSSLSVQSPPLLHVDVCLFVCMGFLFLVCLLLFLLLLLLFIIIIIIIVYFHIWLLPYCMNILLLLVSYFIDLKQKLPHLELHHARRWDVTVERLEPLWVIKPLT